MQITDNKLKDVPFKETPNMGGPIVPEYLVIHYTATTNGPATVKALCSPALKASAHLVLDVDGSLTQLVPFDRKAWHAGKSQWAGKSGCNNFTIGIEIVNPGPVRPQGSEYRDIYGRPWTGAVVEALHKNGSKQFRQWAAFSDTQMTALRELGPLLVEQYQLRDVIGHDDVAPGRKIDPGPAFPMDGYRGFLYGRADDGPELFATTTTLNIRKGPAVSFDPVPGSPLAPGTEVEVVERVDLWWHVLSTETSVEGWVHSRFLRAA